MVFYCLDFSMNLAAFDVDGGHGTRGAVVLAGTAAETAALVDRRLAVDHLDGLRRTVTLAGATTYAVVLQHHGMTYRYCGLLLFGNQVDLLLI